LDFQAPFSSNRPEHAMLPLRQALKGSKRAAFE
jgi:hypothetical protein